MYKNFIAGEWQSSQKVIENINPSDISDVIGEFAQADTQQLADAITSAKKAQLQWQATGLEQRLSVLMQIGNKLIANSQELGEMLAREEGKTLAEGKGEVYRSGQFFQYYAAEVLRQMGDTTDSVRPDIEVFVRREPMGLVSIISPWNFPMATASWKIAPALAFGNAVLWKPSNLTPLSAFNLTEIIAEQDIPAGLFNLLVGSGAEIGNDIVSHKSIDAVSFTGSYATGKQVATNSTLNLTKFQLELGSKNALFISANANIDTAVNCALNGAFFSCGQKCTASSRLVVHSSIHDEFVDKLIIAMQALKVGHALHTDSQLGAIASAEQLASNINYTKIGIEEGAELIGGKKLELEHNGFYFSPGLFLNTNNSMRINKEEMFAPLAAVIKVDSFAEGLEIVNDTEYGLTSGIITNSLKEASDFRKQAQTGCVMVNLPTAGTDYHVPFGGRKNSSFGSREQGKYAEEFYTQVKTSYVFAG